MLNLRILLLENPQDQWGAFDQNTIFGYTFNNKNLGKLSKHVSLVSYVPYHSSDFSLTKELNGS